MMLHCNKEGHYARECPDRKDLQRDDDQDPSHDYQRNDKSNSRGKRSTISQGRGQSFKKARNSRYESNTVDNQQDEYYLPAALFTSAPSDSMGIWLIDSGASRHFTSYKEVLHNLIEKETNLEIVLVVRTPYCLFLTLYFVICYPVQPIVESLC